MITQMLLNQFLNSRGMTADDLKAIDEPTFSSDRTLLDGTDEAISLLHDAHENDRKVVILPDFDCDGVMSATIGIAGLDLLGFDVSLYEPNANEGYGFDEMDIRRLVKETPNVSLILTCDVGTSCADGVKTAREQGIDVIVTDHHEEDPSTSSRQYANVLVNPHASDSQFPFKDICGAHVLWLLISEYARRHTPEHMARIGFLRTFAGIATITDSMPLLHENRAIVMEAIDGCRHVLANDTYLHSIIDGQPDGYVNAFRGLYVTLNVLRKEGKLDRISEDTFGFYIGPMVNSVKRLGMDMHTAYGTFTGEPRKVRMMYDLNEKRKSLVRETLDGITSPYDGEPIKIADKALSGMLGLVAGNITSRTHMPCCVIRWDRWHSRPDKALLNGSCRSPEWLDIRQTLNDIGHVEGEGWTADITAAGHAYACGIEITLNATHAKDRIGSAVRGMSDILKRVIEASMPRHDDGTPDVVPHPDITVTDSVLYDGELASFGKEMSKYHPFGHGFETPSVRMTLTSQSAGHARRIGKDATHLMVTGNGTKVLCWNHAELADEITGRNVTINGRIQESFWNGTCTYEVVGEPAWDVQTTKPERNVVKTKDSCLVKSSQQHTRRKS